MNYKYVVKFNNLTGNTYANRLEDALHDARAIVSYGYADQSIIYQRREDGSLLPVTHVDKKI